MATRPASRDPRPRRRAPIPTSPTPMIVDRPRRALERLVRPPMPAPGDLLAPARRRPVRRIGRWRRWAPALAVAAAGLLAARATAEADGQRARWGASDPVVVLARGVAAGDRVPADAVERRAVPRSLVPAGAATATDDVVGRAARTELRAGEVVVADRLAPGPLEGPAAALGPDERAVAVPVGDDEPIVGPGQRIDLVAPEAGPGLAADGGGARRASVVVTDAAVLDVGPGRVVVAVGADDLDALATALVGGPLLVAARGG